MSSASAADEERDDAHADDLEQVGHVHRLELGQPVEDGRPIVARGVHSIDGDAVEVWVEQQPSIRPMCRLSRCTIDFIRTVAAN